MSVSPPPPTDLGAYARFMHQHTKRQMESISSQSPRSSNQISQSSSSPTRLPGGVSNRNQDDKQYRYRT
ncbi:hypothetical protein N657DRAFT_641802 [Parathielavia appendiculata]|uniref:Uncharacterized protein n=1 Tax=Parathielavia appendiculata TaxID=2587402 RepID=A0AAN6U7A0_9PEZI|nr:hypothetical protein N657DRAFT_641802 [Parathielavia appendiculata]